MADHCGRARPRDAALRTPQTEEDGLDQTLIERSSDAVANKTKLIRPTT